VRRLLVLHYTSPPEVGGCEIAAAELTVAATQHDGLSATLISGTASGRTSEDYGVDTVTIPEMSTGHPLSQAIYHDFRAGRFPAQLGDLARSIRSQLDALSAPGDILLSLNAFSLPYNIALTAALSDLAYARTDIQHATWCFDLAVSMNDYDWTRRDEYPWSLMWRKHPAVEYFVCSPPMRGQLANALGVDDSEFHVLPAGIHALRALRVTDEIGLVYRHRRLEGCFPVVFVPAKMSRRKALHRAVDVIAHLKRDWPLAHLVIAGSPSPHDEATDSYRRQLAQAIRERDLEDTVTVLSWLRRGDPRVTFADTLSMVALSDALLMTSDRETFVIPILEAALSRVPIFVPATQEVAAWAEPYANMYDPSGTPEAIAGLVGSYLRRTDAIRHLAIRRDYSWSAAVSRIISHLSVRAAR
jgi:glycosyltransferase involved in cell wall biosynthesis